MKHFNFRKSARYLLKRIGLQFRWLKLIFQKKIWKFIYQHDFQSCCISSAQTTLLLVIKWSSLPKRAGKFTGKMSLYDRLSMSIIVWKVEAGNENFEVWHRTTLAKKDGAMTKIIKTKSLRLFHLQHMSQIA
jgi:hypothetical protein